MKAAVLRESELSDRLREESHLKKILEKFESEG